MDGEWLEWHCSCAGHTGGSGNCQNMWRVGEIKLSFLLLTEHHLVWRIVPSEAVLPRPRVCQHTLSMDSTALVSFVVECIKWKV